KTLKMAGNMAAASGGMYQQMMVPSAYHFHQPQPQPPPVVQQVVEPKKEPKKRKKPQDKAAGGEKKKPRVIGQTAYLSGTTGGPLLEGEMRGGVPDNSTPATPPCSRCNKKKCFKHAND
ncbi:unnamed protein product, partial [Meganyctiphanes norvegica]